MHFWAAVNLNSNRTWPVCTGLPDNSVYWPDPMVARFFTIFYTVHRPNQNNIRQGSIFLASSRRRANYDNSNGEFRHFTVPGLILGLFDRPHWLSPPCMVTSYSIVHCTILKLFQLVFLLLLFFDKFVNFF